MREGDMVCVEDGGCVGREEEKKNGAVRVRVMSGGGVWVLQSLGKEKMKNGERKNGSRPPNKMGSKKLKKKRRKMRRKRRGKR